MDITFQHLKLIFDESFLWKAFEKTQNRQYIWLVALPKSGSTWLSNILIQMTVKAGFLNGHLMPVAGQRTQEIDPRLFFTLGDEHSKVFFNHQHCPYSEYTEQLVRATNTKVVFLYRDILDIAVSFIDFAEKNFRDNHQPIMDLFPKDSVTWEHEDFVNYVLDCDMPWVVRMAGAWMESPLFQSPQVLPVAYEDLIADTPGEVSRILDFVNIKLEADVIEDALAFVNNFDNKKNQAVSGRGRQTMAPEHIARLERMVGYFDLPDGITLIK